MSRRTADEVRRQIIEAADRLFYSTGLDQISMEAIAAEASLTKRTLYNYYPSKDQLIAGWAARRRVSQLGHWSRYLDASTGVPSEGLLAIFQELANSARDRRWKGCEFTWLAAELAGFPDHPALTVATDHKLDVEGKLARFFKAHEIENPDFLAKTVLVLYDGAVSHILIHKDPRYAMTAGKAALDLLRCAASGKCAAGVGIPERASDALALTSG